MIPTGYDPITLNHWLWFKYQCHESSPTDFQRLFENIIKRAEPEFMQIRPYGRIGDRKCDGLFITDSTVFQVYSPDELKQSEVLRKIDDDLSGAVKHWGSEMKTWVFVYNARRGIAPDIPKILKEKQEQYPNITIKHLSNDALWEIARELTVQQRAEILGAPSGYEHLFVYPDTAPEEIRDSLEKGWFVLIQDVLSPINIRSVVDALEPNVPFGAPLFVRPPVTELPWLGAELYQRQTVEEVLKKSRDLLLPRFAVFSLAPIPLAVHLGFLLSDRVQVRCYQYQRALGTWKWPEISEEDVDLNIQTSGLPSETIVGQTEVIIRISLSARIREDETSEVMSDVPVEIDLFVDEPDVMWLRSPKQLDRLGQAFRQTLAVIREKVPRCSQIHLFYAGPTGGAVSVGQQVNPRMNPPVRVYQYSRQTTPRYRWALTLEDTPPEDTKEGEER